MVQSFFISTEQERFCIYREINLKGIIKILPFLLKRMKKVEKTCFSWY